jgi:protein TonB
MRRLAEIPAFLALALAVHLAILAYEPLRGSDAGGSGGAAVVTLAAAPEQIDQLLREWMQAPEAETALTEALETFDPMPQTPPELRSAVLDPAPRALVQVGAMAVPDLPRAPSVDTEPPPPKARPETEREAAPEKNAKRPPAPPSETAMQKAAGAGRTSQAGRVGPALVKTLSSGQQARLISVWGAKLRSRIERKKRYPRDARGSGVVRLHIQVARSGQLLSSRVVKSSGVAAFDAAALAAIARAAPFPPAPEQLTDGSYSFALNMRFDR